MTNEEVQDAFVDRLGNILKQLSEERDEVRQKYSAEHWLVGRLINYLQDDEAEIKRLSEQGGAYYEAVLIARAALDNGDVDRAKLALRNVPVLE